MNKYRRRVLESIVEKLEELEALHAEVRDLLEDVQSEEQEAFDNLPEGIQMSERGEEMEGYIETMEEVLSDMDDIDLDAMIEKLQEVIG